MNQRKKSILPLLIVIAGLAVVLCAGAFLLIRNNRSVTTVPDEVTELFEKYMDAYKNGVEESVVYAHFEDEFTRSAYIGSNDKMIDYKVESTEKINDDLYCFTLLAKNEVGIRHFGDDYRRVYNFVGRIGDEWYVMNGVGNIPQALQENLDASKYTYTGDNIVDPGDIIGEIGFDQES